MKTVSDKVVGHSLAYLFRVKMIGAGRPLLRKNLAGVIFARSSSAVVPSKKLQLTTIGSPLRAFQ